MGLETQRQRVRDFAQANGYDLLDVVGETASGAVKEGEVCSHAHRPVLAGVIERAGRGEFEALIVASFDRLARDYLTLVFVRRLLRSYGVEALSAAGENGNADAVGELIKSLIAAVHEFERKRILERVRAGKEAGKQLGRHVHGRIPWGYRMTDDGLQPHPQHAKVVRRMFLDAKEGKSPGWISAQLSRDAIPSPSRGEWNRTAVRGIITNDVYCGVRYGARPAHEKVVSRQLFNAVQQALRKRVRK